MARRAKWAATMVARVDLARAARRCRKKMDGENNSDVEEGPRGLAACLLAPLQRQRRV